MADVGHELNAIRFVVVSRFLANENAYLSINIFHRTISKMKKEEFRRLKMWKNFSAEQQFWDKNKAEARKTAKNFQGLEKRSLNVLMNRNNHEKFINSTSIGFENISAGSINFPERMQNISMTFAF